MDAEITRRFFETLAGAFVPDPVAVELLDVPASSPMRATVRWDTSGERWAILADSNMQARQLLYALFHELGHIRHGDVKKLDLWILPYCRDMMLGERGIEADALRDAMGKQGEKPEQQAQEARANAWAEEQTARWWPVLVGAVEAGQRAASETIKRHFQEV